MRNACISLAFLPLFFASGQAMADDRFSCMAQDRHLNLAVHVEFAEELGGRLSHLTGRLGIADPAAPQGLAARRLTSQMQSQSWAGDGVVLLRLFDDETDSRALDVTLSAAAANSEGHRYNGHYLIRSTTEKGPAYEISGALFCQREPERTALLKMFPSEAE